MISFMSGQSYPPTEHKTHMSFIKLDSFVYLWDRCFTVVVELFCNYNYLLKRSMVNRENRLLLFGVSLVLEYLRPH